MTLGEKIKERRIALHMTQAELAGEHLTRNMICELEGDKATPSLKTILYLSERLCASVGYFLDPKRTINDEQMETWFPRVKELFCQGNYEEMISLSEEKLEGIHDDLLSYLLASAHLYVAEACAAGGSVHTAKKHLDRLALYMDATRMDVSHLRARAILCQAMVNDPLTPKYALDTALYQDASETAIEEELFHYIQDDWEYPYKSKVYARHMEAKKLMKEYRYSDAITRLEDAIEDRQSRKISVLLLYRIYADMETCYRERKDYENAYRYATKKISLLTSFRS